jgi:hypothetical protein
MIFWPHSGFFVAALRRNRYNRIPGGSQRRTAILAVLNSSSEGSMSVNLSGQTIVVAAKDQVSCDLGGEAAILSIKNGIYYGLDPVGAQVWNLLQKPLRVVEIHEAVLREYDVEPERCEHDLIILLEKLLAEGLIEVQDGSAARTADGQLA